MSGAIPPLPNTPSWRGALLKRRDKFTLLFKYYEILIIIIIIIIIIRPTLFITPV
jgi:hypothetical protein